MMKAITLSTYAGRGIVERKLDHSVTVPEGGSVLVALDGRLVAVYDAAGKLVDQAKVLDK